MPAPDNLTATIGRNAMFGMVARMAQVGTRLLTVPVVISHLGLDGYGIWNVIMAVASYMRFGSVGVKSAFQKYVAEATGTGEYESANRLLSTGCALMFVLSAALLPMAALSNLVAAAAGVPTKFLHSAARSISLLALIMAISNVGSVFEAILMGGHRIDLARRFTTLFAILEALAILTLLHFGFGLFAMAAVMATSEVGFLTCCAVASRRVVPAIKLARRHITRRVIPELLRFVGTYQLVNLLEVLYAAILPVVMLRTFGANASGVYAVAIRLTSSAQMLSDPFLNPILSGCAMVYASGSAERLRRLILKSFKVVVGLTLFPLGFIAVFGTSLVVAWTGEVNPLFRSCLWLTAAGAFCQSVSLLQLVLYRASGKAIMDNFRQALRILTLLAIALMARRLGLTGTLAGYVLAEVFGMLFMLYAIARTFKAHLVSAVAGDAVRLAAATAGVLVLAVAGLHIPVRLPEARLTVAFQVAVVFVICLLTIWPALRFTRALTTDESEAMRALVLRRKGV